MACRVSFQPTFRSFIYFNSVFYSRHAKLPGRKCARPRRRRRPRPASGATGAGHCHVPGGSAAGASPSRPRQRPALAVVAVVRCRRRPSASCRSSASLLWTSSSPRPSPQVVPAAATSASALQASKFYSWVTAESISDNAQSCDMENELVPLQRENSRYGGIKYSCKFAR